jgi:hypothetical protein
MGEQSTGDSGTAYAEEIDFLAKQRKRQQEERAMRLQEFGSSYDPEDTGKSLFARSESGNIIRSASSGRGVTNRAGRQAQEDYRAAFSGRESRDMDAEFPMGDESQVSMQTGSQNKLEPTKTIKGPSAATRRLLAQGQVSQKTRQFY